MAQRTFDAVVVHSAQDATLHFTNEAHCFKELMLAFKDGAKVSVTIKSRRKPRSLSQNNYLHMCLQMIADETGNSLESVKMTLKAMYAKKPLLDKEGEPIADVESGEIAYTIQDTRDMNTIEAMEFTENVRMFARDFCMMELPLPDQNIKLNLK